jgi:phospholipid/cholesterol/gamma-HCH transport system ATP-binding protein
MEYAIEVKDLKKTFNGRDYILNGLNLNVPKGKITVIIGFSGTGKSVLLKHILGLITPTAGEIRILGKPLHEMTEEDQIRVRMRFGVLFQNAALFDDMTVLENVRFPLDEHRRDFSLETRNAIAAEKLKMSGLEEKDFDKLPSELSGGMKKRCGLARAHFDGNGG